MYEPHHKVRLAIKPGITGMWQVSGRSDIAFLTTPIFTRIMSAEEYGVVSVYNSWISILTVVLTLQLATGVYNKAMILVLFIGLIPN